MSDKPVFKLRWDLLVLDGIGATLFALGLAKKVAGLDILPPALRFDSSGWMMIILGVLLMLPFMLNFLAQIRDRTEGKRFK
ncbi:MAG: hypothetical protein ACSHWN_05825 [Methylophilaceae bacterium]